MKPFDKTSKRNFCKNTENIVLILNYGNILNNLIFFFLQIFNIVNIRNNQLVRLTIYN